MSAMVWARFFWADWESDPALRLCSLAAQGLWMRLLCVAARSDPPGYVQVNGHLLRPEEIARVCGISTAEAGALLSDLDRHGVFSRDRRGCIYSRRIVRDAKRTAELRTVGNKGGNPDIRRGTVPKAGRVRPFKRSDSPAKTRRIFEREDGKCHWCKAALAFDGPNAPNLFRVDHLKPVCDGGTNDESNLVAACAKCNHARARKDWEKPPDPNPDNKTDPKAHLPLASNKKEFRNLSSVVKGARRAREAKLVDFARPENRQAWARQKMQEFVSAEILMAAEDPRHPNHRQAVKLARAAADKAEVTWCAPKEGG